jgi:hypothetical protein
MKTLNSSDSIETAAKRPQQKATYGTVEGELDTEELWLPLSHRRPLAVIISIHEVNLNSEDYRNHLKAAPLKRNS